MASKFYLQDKWFDINADEAIFVDDSLRNIKGAEAVGIGGIHYQLVDVCTSGVYGYCHRIIHWKLSGKASIANTASLTIWMQDNLKCKTLEA